MRQAAELQQQHLDGAHELAALQEMTLLTSKETLAYAREGETRIANLVGYITPVLNTVDSILNGASRHVVKVGLKIGLAVGLGVVSIAAMAYRVWWVLKLIALVGKCASLDPKQVSLTVR